MRVKFVTGIPIYNLFQGSISSWLACRGLSIEESHFIYLVTADHQHAVMAKQETFFFKNQPNYANLNVSI